MHEPRLPSPFIELASVEAWDAWFRWREPGQLRDTSIEDTWQRVATCLATAETGATAARVQHDCMDALASWRLLPDARLLAHAGSGQHSWHAGPLHAVLNVAAFVVPGGVATASIALAALTDTAALALRCLDNAGVLVGKPHAELRIGLVGVADALALLGLAYDSEAGRAQAAALAQALATGCLHGNVALARERAPTLTASTDIAWAIRSGLPPELLRDANQYGLRHPRSTAVTSQPRLALLANDVADALDPLRGAHHAHRITAPGGVRTLRSSGYALNLLRGREDSGAEPPHHPLGVTWMAQLALRAAVQPWFDQPVCYPLVASGEPDAEQQHLAAQFSAQHGLAAPAWRHPARAWDA